MYKGIVICVFLSFASAFALPPAVEWISLHGPGSYDPANDIHQCADGSYIAAGSSDVNFASSPDGQLVKLTTTGAADWIDQYGGSGADNFTAVTQNAGGEFVAAGSSYRMGIAAFSTQAWLLVTDANGVQILEVLYGDDSLEELVYDMQPTADGGYIVVGHIFDPMGVTDDNLLALKLSSTYTIDWAQTIDLGKHEAARAVVQATDGGYVIAGWQRTLDFANTDGLAIKLDAGGNVEWTQVYDISSFDILYGVDRIAGGYVMCGAQLAPNFFRDALLMRTNSSGVPLWITQFGYDGDEAAHRVVATDDGGIAFSGVEDFDENSDPQAVILKTDGAGGYYWDLSFGAAAIDEFYSLEQTSDGGYIISGIQFSNEEEDHDGLYVKLDADEPLPVELLSFAASTAADGIQISFETASEQELSHFEIWKSSGESALFSQLTTLPATNGSTPQHYRYLDRNVVDGNEYSYFLVSVDLNGSREEHRDRTATVLYAGESVVPAEYALTAYPNPFNPTTTLDFSLPEATHARLAVYELNGKLAAVLSEGEFSAGSHSLTFDAENFAAGTYFARLETSNQALVTKLLLLK